MSEKDNAAKIAFYKAFNKCQGAIAPIKADSVNDHFKSKYASLQAVMEAVGPFFEAGFSIHHEAFYQDGKSLLRTSLVLGDYATTSVLPLVDDGNPQHLASSQTYAKRGNVLNLTALALDVDDDGNAATKGAKSYQGPSKLAQDTPAAAVAAVKAGNDEWHTAQFIPVSVEPRGNGWDITAPDGTVYGTLNKDKSSIAQHAMLHKKNIALSYVNKGKFKSIGKIAQVEVQQEEESVPF